MRDFIADRPHYIINHIEPKDGALKNVHETMLGRDCQIMTLEIGRAGVLLVDVGDHNFGPHKIVLSHILGVEEQDVLLICTENTTYHLKRIDSDE